MRALSKGSALFHFNNRFSANKIYYFLVSEQESNQRNRPGRGITSKSLNCGAIATGNRPILIRCAEHHLAPDPTPAAIATAH